MGSRILSFKTVVTSWGVSLVAWTLVWWLLPLMQGLATLLADGSFIGISVPAWTQPWALVNEPSVGFAASRTALWLYWLPPFFVAALLPLVALALPPSGSLDRHMFLLHLALGASALGLAWLPGLGWEDGLLGGLARFFLVDSAKAHMALLLLSAAIIRFPVLAMASYLWFLPGGPTPTKKLLLGTLHVLPAPLIWGIYVLVLAPQLPLKSFISLAVTTLMALTWPFLAKPRHPLRRRELASSAPWLSFALVFLFVIPSGIAFSPYQGRPRGFLWGKERMTSNVRREVVRFPIKLLPSPEVQPVRSLPKS